MERSNRDTIARLGDVEVTTLTVLCRPCPAPEPGALARAASAAALALAWCLSDAGAHGVHDGPRHRGEVLSEIT